MFPESC